MLHFSLSLMNSLQFSFFFYFVLVVLEGSIFTGIFTHFTLSRRKLWYYFSPISNINLIVITLYQDDIRSFRFYSVVYQYISMRGNKQTKYLLPCSLLLYQSRNQSSVITYHFAFFMDDVF